MGSDEADAPPGEIRLRPSEAPRRSRAPLRPSEAPRRSRAPLGRTSPSAPGAAPLLIALGASTGGVHALERILRALPPDAPPVVVVQHMPPGFTRRFADRCDGFCAVAVKEAEDGDELREGLALIAPGDHHLRVVGSRVAVARGPRVNGHCPSVDVLFESVARSAGARAVGALLTGMGRDGARGLLQMKQAGARTIAQDEETCVVFGMPEAAISLGAVDRVLPLEAIAACALGRDAT